MRNSLLKKYCLVIGMPICLWSCSEGTQFTVKVDPSKEDLDPSGYKYTPSTQSFLRGHHWLEAVSEASFEIKSNLNANIEFDISKKESDYISLKNLPLNQLVPRLHYSVSGKYDDFDLFNLMMAEFSRNGLSFPYGVDGDDITHFQTNLIADIPWELNGDYDFAPNPKFKPIRLSVVNNCLSSGLWEMNASDKTGEVYHSWFNFPKDIYFELVSEVNNIPVDVVKKALQWKDNEVGIDLDRLRSVTKEYNTTKAHVVNEAVSYSSQGSRRKLSKGFVTCLDSGKYSRPKTLHDVITKKVKMAEFVEPGIYSLEKKMDFDFGEYMYPESVEILEVDPKTSYDFEGEGKMSGEKEFRYVEIKINLPSHKVLIVGNVPLNLLVQQEDFTLHGFGVGILSAGGFAERRRLLIEKGPAPSFAYLAKEENGKLIAQNSHMEGLEQVFIRSYPNDVNPHWDITFTSYERITDIVKYRIPIPKELIEEQKINTKDYITPVYFSYRDDNLR